VNKQALDQAINRLAKLLGMLFLGVTCGGCTSIYPGCWGALAVVALYRRIRWLVAS
jgi:hypothetical protein